VGAGEDCIIRSFIKHCKDDLIRERCSTYSRNGKCSMQLVTYGRQ
jgi:hypothetical protein